MGWCLTEEHELLIENIKEWARRNVDEAKVKQWYADFNVSDELCKSYMEAGLGLMGVPEEYGGVATDALTLAVLNETVDRECGSIMPMPGATLMVWDICEFGTKEQIEKFVVNGYMKTGRCTVGLGISEPGAGSDNSGMTTTVKTVNGKLILNGQKTFGSCCRNNTHTIIVAKDEDASRENKNYSMWIVPNDAPGFKQVEVEEIAVRLMPFSDIYLDNVELDPSWLLGTRGKGFIQLMKNFELERILAVAGSLGIAQAAMDEAAAYTSQRIVFQQPIANFQLIQKKLVDMETKLQLMRNFIYKTAWDKDNGAKGINTNISLLKYYCAKTAHEVCDDAMNIFAGIGFTTDHRVSRMWMETKGYEFAGGTAEIMVHIAGRQLAKKYAR